VWRPAPGLAAPPVGDDLERWVAPEIERWRDDDTLARHAEALGDLDRLSAVYIERALEQLGGPLARGAIVRPDAMIDRGAVVPRYRPLLTRLLTILAEDGLLRSTSAGWVVEREPHRRDVRDLERELTGRGAVSPELGFLLRCGPRLSDVLRGTCDPLSLLFPNGSFEMAERLYHESPMSPVLGGLVRETVLGLQGRMASGRPIRIIEVGGGTGGTTGVVLPALAQVPCEYMFTDVSLAFTARAASRFSAYPFLRAQALDIEADPIGQGFTAGHFDVVIAANVVHATADLRRTLEHCRRLLAPGGLLILVEMTVPQRWVDLTFGLTDGWWKFADVAVRPDYPLLSGDRWTALLAESGFGVARTLPDPCRITGPLAEQAVIVGVRDGDTAPRGVRDDGPWIVLADRGGIGDRLAASLRARDEGCRILRSGDRFRADADEITVDPEQADQVSRGLHELCPVGAPPPRGVVHLWGLDAPADLDEGFASGAPLRGAAGALHVAQGLLEVAASGTCFWLVTRGAHRLSGDTGLPSAIQAPLWGLGRTIALEHPELGCQCIDLDPSPTADPSAALLAEISSPADENEVAWRGGDRFAPRLARWPAAKAVNPGPAEPVRLEPATRGSLESLTLRPMSRRAPGPGEVEIRVRVAGLNFKDVLSALDMYPGNPGPLGGECAGTVVAVGPGVEGVAVGAEVVALAPGSFATHVTADATFVAPRPTALSVEEAASLPIAYVTAAYTLHTIGGIKAGDRVLIHAGAGGVGLAAIMLARRCGATVLATAGRPEKRAFLEAQGVGHVFDSRSLGFREGVMAATGGRGVDLVLNSLSGDAIEATLAVMAPNGRFVEIGKRGILEPAEVRRRRPDVSYTIVDWGDVARANPALIRRHLLEILEGVGRGAIPALPVTRFPLAEAPAAFRHMAQARHIGKIVLEAPREPAAASIRPDASYLVTGGFGGLGIEVARRLADRGARYLVLMGRRAPAAAASAAIEALRLAGAQVSTVEADVADGEAVARIVADIDRTGPPLRGIVHAAGTLDNAILARQDVSRLSSVMAAKVVGTWNLERATRDRALDFFVLFSSSASVLGAPGQANHAAANVFLDALAQHRRARGLSGLSLDWGAWSEVGAAAREETARRIALDGMGRMRPDEALAAFERAMAGDEAQIAILPVDWGSLMARRSAAGRLPSLLRGLQPATGGVARVAAPGPTADGLLARLEAAAPARRRQLLAEHVAGRVVRVLGLDPSHPIDPLRPLKEMGIDSLMAVELRNGLKADLRLDGGLPATLAFDHPTVEAIAAYLAQEALHLSTSDPDDAPASAEAPEAESMLSRLEQLSDDEVDRLLHERSRSGGA
jgi:NADPH:quinone reductase-like Zn-dependent oxidoreductase/SAM-dependent methyltransferase